MQFLYHELAKDATLTLDAKAYSHVLKVRRAKIGDRLFVRNMIDDILYEYTITSINKKYANLDLIGEKYLKIEAEKAIHVGWCVVDPKMIEKTLPFLNELGVSTISFVYCEFSQQQFKIDLDRLKRILINSSQQCGRSHLMHLEVFDTLAAYVARYPDSKIIDFSENRLKNETDGTTFLIGCEGGFSSAERDLFPPEKRVGLQTPMILRSETALLSLCSHLLT
ncbi:16S rRNA (uracil(1498)-N(3))-methyltransferase [Sulfurospirillum sp. 1612]|uniref:16S rRNA (uracil(1498)-N(3))-methyltransferase n=1 Tax=Sulfurospirillum sp. 1612 TaxID=3094835 RepID=UPI002F946C34